MCFSCDGKWEPNHRCPKKEMSVIIAGFKALEEEEVSEGDSEDGGPTGESPNTPVINLAEVSLNSVVGLTNPRTMKLKGELRGKGVVVMIDPGATHNFISKEVVSKLGIPISGGRSYEISLGNGAVVKGQGTCKGVQLQLQGANITEEFLRFPLGNSGLILGVQ